MTTPQDVSSSRELSSSRERSSGDVSSSRERSSGSQAVRQAIAEAARLLAQAGVSSPRADAEALAAHAGATTRGLLPLLEAPDAQFFDRLAELVGARARRVPLQHLVGTAAFGPVLLHVGPGVFVPRPETEALLEWATRQDLPPGAVVVDLCTGSGALAVALAHAMPSARVVGLDISHDALTYARRNATGTQVELRLGDVRDGTLLHDLYGRVDLVVANPPYLPDGIDLEPEVAEHDPAQALFGGQDGNALIADIAPLAARCLRPGGVVAVEHDDSASHAVARIFTGTGSFESVTSHTDFTGRPRFVSARRKADA